MMMGQVVKLDLCLVCCSKVKSDSNPDNNSSELLSRNLNVFYLLRKVFKVTGIQLKYSLISCGNLVEWIKLCDKCTELSQHAEKLYRNLRRIERELNLVEKLIWDKARLSINCEAERKLGAEETIDLRNKSTSQVWRAIRKNVANKGNSSKRNGIGSRAADNLINPFSEGDKLANYLITQNVFTAILPNGHSNVENEEDEDDHVNILEETKEPKATSLLSSSPSSPLKIKMEPQLPEIVEDGPNYDNLLIDSLLEELEDVKSEFEDDAEEEGMEVDEDALGGGDNMADNGDSESQEQRSSKHLKRGRKPTVLRTEDGKFKCRHCDQTFARHSGLNGHEREKHCNTPGAFTCDLCPRTFNSRDYLRKHVKRHHEPSADGTPKIKVPKMIRTGDGKYQCVQCDQIFQSLSGCTSHQRDKHSETPGAFVCDLCGRAFNSHDFLRSHKAISHKVKPDGTPILKKPPKLEKDNMCEQCGKGFKTAIQLRKHIRFVHEKRFNVKCTLCGLGCRNMYSLKKHQLAMHPEDPSVKKLIEEEGLGLWKCPVIGCTVRFLKESSLKGHLKSIHGKDEDGLDIGAGALEDPDLKVACPICGKVYPSKQSLRSHEKLIHENDGKGKDFICESCGGGFVSKVRLKAHVDRVHLRKGIKKEKEFKCEICGKGYTHRHLLKVHLEIHGKEGKRDIFCDKCGHGFTMAKYLRIHKRRTNCGLEGKQARVYNRKGE